MGKRLDADLAVLAKELGGSGEARSDVVREAVNHIRGLDRRAQPLRSLLPAKYHAHGHLDTRDLIVAAREFIRELEKDGETYREGVARLRDEVDRQSVVIKAQRGDRKTSLEAIKSLEARVIELEKSIAELTRASAGEHQSTFLVTTDGGQYVSTAHLARVTHGIESKNYALKRELAEARETITRLDAEAEGVAARVASLRRQRNHVVSKRAEAAEEARGLAADLKAVATERDTLVLQLRATDERLRRELEILTVRNKALAEAAGGAIRRLNHALGPIEMT